MIGNDRNKEFHLMRAALAYADEIKRVATCDRAQYACVITDLDLRVLSYGFNGVAKNLPNGCLRPDYDKVCPECNGDGVLDAGPEWNSDNLIPCPECDGRSIETNVVVHGCGCIHAEANAVMGLRRSQYEGPIIAFGTGQPCEQCAMMLIQSNCVMVVYDRPSHRKYGGEDLLKRAGIPHGKATEMAELLTRNKKANSVEEKRPTPTFGRTANYAKGHSAQESPA